jgi:large subunit ribosomal protein L4e
MDLSPLIRPPYQVPRTGRVLGLDGSVVGEVELPPQFSDPVRRDLIMRAYLSALSARFQPKGVDPMAGMRSSAESFGVGLGIARVPRVKGSPGPGRG